MCLKGDERMEKIKSLNNYQKGILILMVIMSLVFAVIYSMTISKVGFEFNDKILVYRQEGENTIYQGKIKGQEAQFTVSQDKVVVFEYGDKIYGPYSAKEDPTAISKELEALGQMTGVEVRQGENIIFRGGVSHNRNNYFNWLYNEDGSLYSRGVYYIDDNGIERDENGEIFDQFEPSVYTILKLMNSPELIHRGDWGVYYMAMFICVLNAISILFVEELFRFNLSFQIKNAHNAEPSDWEITGRYICWTIFTIGALIIFNMGLYA